VLAGVAVRADRLGDEGYAAAASTLFSSVTPENELKWERTEPEAGSFSFEDGDQVVDFAREHDLRVRGHALVWHSQLPEWVRGTEEEMARHIRGVVSHYRGRVAQWDVVNEALEEDGKPRDTPFLREQGPGYIARAFVLAHRADPDARLAYNDYGTESPDSEKGRALYQLVRALKGLEAPIDVVGFQAHADLNGFPDLERQLRRVAALGVDVELTEVVVRLPADATDEDLRRQAAVYRDIAAACRAVPRCRAITVWGLSDADSWIDEFYPDFGHATLLDDDLNPKPAYRAFAAALR
jgi:endo-1,4-beta-xylanase